MVGLDGGAVTDLLTVQPGEADDLRDLGWDDDDIARHAPEPDAMDRAVAALEAELLDSDGLDAIPELEPLIDGYLYRNSMARVIGPSGSMKSFVMLDFAGHIGAGHDWHGHRTKQGLVIYLVAEGGGGVRKRVRAWEQYHGHKMTGVKFLPRPVQAGDLGQWAVLIEVCKRLGPALVIFDTQARITVGVEENSAKEMGLIVQRLENLREASGACVALVHHQGLSGEHGRGSTSVKGALQTELRVAKKGKGAAQTRITVSSDKQKDDEELGDMVFAVEVVKLAGEAKEGGSPVTSVVLVPGASLDAAAADGGERLRPSARRVHQVLEDAAGPVRVREIGDVLAAQEGGPLKARTIQLALNELLERGLAATEGAEDAQGSQAWRASAGQ